MEQKEFIRRIIENRNGKLSQEDYRVLEAWKAKSDDNRAFVKSIERTLDLTADYGNDLEFDSSKAFSKFTQTINNTAEVIPLKKSVSKRRFLKIAASVAILLAVISTIWVNQGNATSEIATLYSEKGESITLIDQSKVVLNQKSHLEHFTSMPSNSRNVKLNGEAFFDVYKISDKPFLINTNSIQIEVLGTSFNVRDLDSEEESLVFVKTGKVKISSISNPRKKIILTPGEQVIFNKKTGNFTKSIDNKTINALSWMEGKLSFNKTKLKYALKDLERHFGVSIKLNNKAIEDCPYTSLFNEPQEANIIETIAATFNLHLKQLGDSSYELSGGSCE